MNLIKTLAKQVGLFLLVLVINSIPFILIKTQKEFSPSLQWLAALSYLLVSTLVIRLVWRQYKTYESQEVRKARFSWKDFGIAFLFFLATRLVAIVGSLLNFYLNGAQMTANDSALMATAQQLKEIFPLYFICFHLAIGLFAPILEEVVYRGFISKYFFRENQKILPLIIISSLFSLPHLFGFNLVEFGIYFALGAIFYLAYARRKNIRDAIAVHILNNSLLVIFSIINYILLLFGN